MFDALQLVNICTSVSLFVTAIYNVYIYVQDSSSSIGRLNVSDISFLVAFVQMASEKIKIKDYTINTFVFVFLFLVFFVFFVFWFVLTMSE